MLLRKQNNVITIFVTVPTGYRKSLDYARSYTCVHSIHLEEAKESNSDGSTHTGIHVQLMADIACMGTSIIADLALAPSQHITRTVMT